MLAKSSKILKCGCSAIDEMAEELMNFLVDMAELEPCLPCTIHRPSFNPQLTPMIDKRDAVDPQRE